ncbi:MAG TPA: phenylalanine--tRNA ligase subunit alpha [Candidatus Nanoarchaeia archaeon]|nr:phenylalanine--tRNA ligase subunit alpha [Candidatus Nanoarchaeia archaeon]
MTASILSTKKLAQSLHQYERRVLPELLQTRSVKALVAKTGLKEVEVTRALQWLENKKAITVSSKPQEWVFLEKNGDEYAKKGLPERRFLEIIDERQVPVAKLAAKTGLSGDEVNICLGLLRQRGLILLLKEKELAVKITDSGKKTLAGQFAEETLLKKNFPLELATLSAGERKTIDDLRKRKNILRVDVQNIKRAEITDVGKKLLEIGVHDDNIIDALTPQMLVSGQWKKKTFRRFDVTSPVPNVSFGKKQPYRAFLDQVRAKFIALGFQEMDGPIVENDFWNMDALFMPQFHSARDIHDAYYIKEPKYGEIDESVIKKVKAAHEHGGDTGSTGWQYEFDVERTKQHVLRTQDTAISPRTLASADLKIPGKYFQIVRCFRHDVIDATHLPDFNQLGGFVIEEKMTFRHLVSLLKLFAEEFAQASEIKLVPGYFPFTEPSVELYAKHPQLGWIELGGAGMFRPEVVKPLVGKHVQVCAWGLGVDRLGMFNLGMNDIRQLFSQDIDFLRKSRVM